METVYVTMLRRTLDFFPNIECTGWCHREYVSRKTLLQDNPAVFNWQCRLMQI